MAQDSGQTSFDHLLGNVAGHQPDLNSGKQDSLVLVTIGDGHTLPLFVIALSRLDIIDEYVNILADKTFPQESCNQRRSLESTHSLASLAQYCCFPSLPLGPLTEAN